MKKLSPSEINAALLMGIKFSEMREDEDEIIHDALKAYIDSRRHREMRTRAWHARMEAERKNR